MMPAAYRVGPRAAGTRRHGTVLLLVLVVVMILSFAGFSFTAYTYTEHKAARLHGEMLEAEQAALSAETYVLRILEMTPEELTNFGGLWDAPQRFRNVSLSASRDQTLDDGPHFTVLAPRYENSQLNGVRYGLVDDSSRLHLARVLAWEQQSEGMGKAALMRLPGMTETICDSLLDWMDADDEPRAFGAEGEFYGALEKPYRPRNGVPLSIEELLLVRGMTREILFGGDVNLNYEIEPSEEALASAASADPLSGSAPPLAHFLTVSSAEGMLRPDGRPRIQLNQDDLARLHAELLESFGSETADFVVALRQFGSSASSAENSSINYPEAEPSGFRRAQSASQATVNLELPATIALTSPLDVVDVAVTGTGASGQTMTWNSPFASSDAASAEQLRVWLDSVTTHSESRVSGRINVNTAPREVLLSVPGLSESTVEQIVAARESRTSNSEPRPRSAAWLWTEGIVSLETMKSLEPYVTGQGDVWEAQIVAFWPQGGPAYRAYALFDATTRPARRLYWKDLRMIGVGFTIDQLAEPAPGAPEVGSSR